MRSVIKPVVIATALATSAGLLTPAMGSDTWVGKYSGSKDSYHWRATIVRKSAGTYALHASVTSHMPACSGDVDAVARSSGDRLVVDSKDCSLAIMRKGAGIKIEEKQCLMWHGAACGFDSELARN